MGAADRVRQTLLEHSMVKSGDKVIVCLSGGADSVCLLLTLLELKEEFSLDISAVHVEHGLRGEESIRDMRFCESLCQRLGVPLQIFRVDVKKRVAETGESTEEAARKLRYQAFEQAAKDGEKLATAHNKCDSGETVLFNLARGTGIKGLCGIPYVRGNIIRPLLDLERREIEEYLSEKGEAFVTDSSNLADGYSRNKIRHSVIPVLTEINGGFFEAASRLSKSAAEDEDYFEQLIALIPEDKIHEYPPSVRKRYIRKKLSENDISCSYERLCILDGMMTSGRDTRYNLSGNIFAVFSHGCMDIRAMDGENIPAVSMKIVFGEEQDIFIPEYDKIVKIERLCNDIFPAEGNVQKKLTNQHLNCDKIQGVVTLRTKGDGDTVGLVGRDFDTRLKKLYNSLKLTSRERLTALVMEDEAGIIWSEYGGVSRRVHASPGDKRIFSVKTVKISPKGQ